MKYPETLMPIELQFETVATGMGEEVEEFLLETLHETGDIVNVEWEFARDARSLWDFSENLSLVLQTEQESIAEVQPAIYRGNCFALQVVGMIQTERIEHLETDRVFEFGSGTDLRKALVVESLRYFAIRPVLNDFLQRHMPEIDPSHRLNHHAEVGAGLTFLLAERTQASMYLSDNSVSTNSK